MFTSFSLIRAVTALLSFSLCLCNGDEDDDCLYADIDFGDDCNVADEELEVEGDGDSGAFNAVNDEHKNMFADDRSSHTG